MGCTLATSNGIPGRYLAVNLDYRNEVVFYELRRNGCQCRQSRALGEPLKVGKDPTLVNSHLMVAHITTNWMRNFQTNITTLEQRLPTSRGTLSVARLSVGTEASRAAQGRFHGN